MTLRRRTFAIVSATMCVLTLVALGTARLVLVRSFEEFEERDARQQLERALSALKSELEALQSFTYDYAAWTRTYEFMANGNDEFLEELPNSRHGGIRVDVVALFDPDGRLVLGRSMDWETGTDRSLGEDASRVLAGSGLLVQSPDSNRGTSGVVVLPRAPLLAASWPILRSDDSGPSRGTMLLGRYLDEKAIRRLSQATVLQLSLAPLQSSSPDVRAVESAVLAERTGVVRALDERWIAAYQLIRGVKHEPAFILRVTADRPIREQQRQTIAYLLCCIAAGGLVLGGVTLALLEKAVLSRLRRLEQDVSQITAHDGIVGRVRLGGNDEVSRLAAAMNRMLEALQASHQSLSASEQRYELAVRGAKDGIWDWDLRSAELYVSPRWASMLGYEASELGRSPRAWLGLVHPEDLAKLVETIDRHRVAGSLSWEQEYRAQRKDGRYQWLLCRGMPVADSSGEIIRMVGSQSDIGARKQLEERLLRQALFDELTGLPNRTLLMEQVSHALARSRRHPDRRCALLFIDLDRFKVVNDSLGHLGGDGLLAGVAQRLRACVRPDDTIARVGGDEFVVLLHEVRDSRDAVGTAERVQRELRTPITYGKHELFTTASIGIATSDTGHESPEELLRDADTAMYRAKSLGRARYALFSADMQCQASELLQRESDLRGCVERNELALRYQPIVDLRNETVFSLEALVRWRPRGGPELLPRDFIQIAEDTGLVVPIGAWVLNQACQQAATWQESVGQGPPGGVMVNVSARQLQDDGFTDTVRAALASSGLDPHLLKLEVTESAVIANLESARLVLKGLKALGVQVALDDFGVGYSALSALNSLPIDLLKLDGSFVSAITASPRNRRIVEAVVLLAQNLGIELIAEAIETAEQLEELRRLGCHWGQGYLFSPALPAEEVSELLAGAKVSGRLR